MRFGGVGVRWMSFPQIFHQLHLANSFESSKQMETELNIADVGGGRCSPSLSQVNNLKETNYRC